MTRFKYYSNYLACLLGTLIAFRALLDRRQVRHRGRGGPHLPRPLHRRVRIVLYHP